MLAFVILLCVCYGGRLDPVQCLRYQYVSHRLVLSSITGTRFRFKANVQDVKLKNKHCPVTSNFKFLFFSQASASPRGTSVESAWSEANVTLKNL